MYGFFLLFLCDWIKHPENAQMAKWPAGGAQEL
jgi:hypothetical protein